MLQRQLYRIAFSEEWGRQMRFITGPRQSGKTTLALQKLEQEGTRDLYYLWDLRSVRNQYKQNELFFTEKRPAARKKLWVCFDEIHKMPKWKNILKGIFDSSHSNYSFVITGSAKLNIFRRAGDSLTGRYFTFQLFPLSLAELSGCDQKTTPPLNAEAYVSKILDSVVVSISSLSDLLEFSGFPEPFLQQSKTFYSKWSEDYTDTVVREDIGALTRIVNREYLFDLYLLLPQFVGNPISVSSLASHLELNHLTIKNYLRRLDEFFLIFKIQPYAKKIKRSLVKAPKCYLYDWSRVFDPAKRFENYVAVELSARLALWGQMSENHYDLRFIRNHQGEETDFLILENNKPWLLIEAKFSDAAIDSHHSRTQSLLENIPFVQICRQEGVCRRERKNTYRVSASRFFSI